MALTVKTKPKAYTESIPSAYINEDSDFTNKLYEQLKRRWAEEYGGDTEENESSNIGV